MLKPAPCNLEEPLILGPGVLADPNKGEVKCCCSTDGPCEGWFQAGHTFHNEHFAKLLSHRLESHGPSTN